ncbi:hypothetical protein ACLD02_16975 [Alloalcanivorax sp. C16-2]|uniref:hypothetical protein n=1 Tax=Alloalcanivorax TaxID=3020832 RepID=UPI001934032E|nr:hypothetical protein [Alloalcanivorax marinus]MBL7249803.1 hypothetical protein [Alloalcanivorax marinus]
MQRSKWIWLIWAVVVLCYVVPYTVLSDVHAWYGSFLFWTLAGVAVIVVNFIITKDFEGH